MQPYLEASAHILVANPGEEVDPAVTHIALELAARTLCVLAVEHFPLVRTRNIITRTDLSLSPAAKAFCDEVRSLVRAARSVRPGRREAIVQLHL
jgi:hypothetical protein